MRVCFFDCFSGAAGDMILGALLDAGAPEEEVRGALDALGIATCDLVVHDVGGPAGLLFAVENPERVRRLVLLNTTVYKRDYKPPLPAVAQMVRSSRLAPMR